MLQLEVGHTGKGTLKTVFINPFLRFKHLVALGKIRPWGNTEEMR